METRLRADLGSMSPKLREVAQYCLAHARHLHTYRIQYVAEQCHTQPVTVVRLAKRYGFRGFMDFKMAFLEPEGHATETGNVIAQCRLAVAQQASDTEPAYARAADLLRQARTVWLLCTVNAAAIAQCYAELLRLAGVSVQWLSLPQHTQVWDWQMGRRDLILCVSLNAQAQVVTDAEALAQERGIALLTISDRLANQAAHAATAPTAAHLSVANLGKGMQGLSAAIVLAQAVHEARA